MRPKGKLFALFAVFAAIGLVTASGAFTTVQAERTADVTTAGDANALLAIQPASGPNGQAYASTDGNDVVQIQLTNNSANVNNNATTEVDRVINITNQGTQDVTIYIERTGANSEAVTFYSGDASTGTNITTASNSGAETLTPGESTNISMTIDTTNVDVSSDTELLSDITIYANATSS